jgi:hypothetical protein
MRLTPFKNVKAIYGTMIYTAPYVISMAQPPPTCPRNISARMKSITYGAV